MRRGRDRLLAQLRPHVADERVLAAVHAVPRDRFVPAKLARDAWENIPLPIGNDQTISQPLVVARMCELLRLRGDERVLDIGTGSGYHAAILARLTAHVWSVERHAALSEQAALNLAAAEVANVTLLVGDGTRGLPETAPFDAINVAAAAAAIPPALQEQLTRGGRLVAPVEEGDQRLVVIEHTSRGFERTTLERVRFVPLI
ncbi:protein-L-isoaspartate(D-aspartate) O-methyltransferase [Solirubrobacter phytolaccae]|uniref:Protein-L-isoaspartate O-methyltransferase n=1 Tax=Solirubrobacter phytolaccae TaxID=1404360 RepID=A0A9X3S7D9_9ACTN|nr:protein-L-isoaspartate(D-aspartate) O-methyltransferase [Solirubrobacter phytolaccae]MDA0179046.1 protein-L-isoaspartate(D-aspartate) O-methyltransferase [Solirubrobacter phytolaccae]